MSQVATPPSVSQFLIGLLRQTLQTYVSDLSHVPADKLDHSPMGVARTPLNFTAECAGLNRYFAGILRGGPAEFPSAEQRDAYLSSLDTYDKAVQELEASVEALASAIADLGDEGLAREFPHPYGRPETMPGVKLATIPSTHMAYHDGQINYIQALYGDADLH